VVKHEFSKIKISDKISMNKIIISSQNGKQGIGAGAEYRSTQHYTALAGYLAKCLY